MSGWGGVGDRRGAGSMGPISQPCGTPRVRLSQSDASPVNTTCCFLSVSQSAIHSPTRFPMPCDFIFLHYLLRGTLSKAFWKTRYIESVGIFESQYD